MDDAPPPIPARPASMAVPRRTLDSSMATDDRSLWRTVGKIGGAGLAPAGLHAPAERAPRRPSRTPAGGKGGSAPVDGAVAASSRPKSIAPAGSGASAAPARRPLTVSGALRKGAPVGGGRRSGGLPPAIDVFKWLDARGAGGYINAFVRVGVDRLDNVAKLTSATLTAAGVPTELHEQLLADAGKMKRKPPAAAPPPRPPTVSKPLAPIRAPSASSAELLLGGGGGSESGTDVRQSRIKSMREKEAERDGDSGRGSRSLEELRRQSLRLREQSERLASAAPTLPAVLAERAERESVRWRDSVRGTPGSALFAELKQELLLSERDYRACLETIVRLVLQPLQASSRGKGALLTPRELACIFSNVEQLGLLSAALLEELEAGRRDIGGAFRFIGPFFKLYTVYTENHARATSLLRARVDKRPRLAEELHGMLESRARTLASLGVAVEVGVGDGSGGGGGGGGGGEEGAADGAFNACDRLAAALSRPLTRLQQYTILLKRMCLVATADDSLASALRLVQDVADHVEAYRLAQLSAYRMSELQRAVGDSLTVIQPDRMYVRKEHVRAQALNGGLPPAFARMVLFNDALLLMCGRLNRLWLLADLTLEDAEDGAGLILEAASGSGGAADGSSAADGKPDRWLLLVASGATEWRDEVYRCQASALEERQRRAELVAAARAGMKK